MLYICVAVNTYKIMSLFKVCAIFTSSGDVKMYSMFSE